MRMLLSLLFCLVFSITGMAQDAATFRAKLDATKSKLAEFPPIALNGRQENMEMIISPDGTRIVVKSKVKYTGQDRTDRILYKIALDDLDPTRTVVDQSADGKTFTVNLGTTGKKELIRREYSEYGISRNRVVTNLDEIKLGPWPMNQVEKGQQLKTKCVEMLNSYALTKAAFEQANPRATSTPANGAEK